MITLHAAEKSKLYQWDTGRRINIILDQNCDTECIEVQFATALNSALTVKPILISTNQYVAEIPNIFLQDSMTISAYVVLRDENSKYVHEHRSFEVVRREKPDDYVYTETEVLRYEKIESAINAMQIEIDALHLKRIEKTVSDTVVELEPNTLYVFPEMETLTYTLAPSDPNIVSEYHFIFTSGEAPTEVVHPENVKIGNFEVNHPNRTYEVSILEGLLIIQSWEDIQ